LKLPNKALLGNFHLMIDLLAASAIMRSKVFMHKWLIMGKGQNVKNQNVKSLICLIFKF
jgi:hypothetical protein